MFELNWKTITTATVVAIGCTVGGWLVWDASKIPDYDTTPMKNSIVERFKHATEYSHRRDIRDESFERVRTTLRNDIKAFYPEEYHAELLAFVDEQWTIYYNM